ncbi:type II toxin-antitoxin system RelE family toxin [Wolbachia endosymbiont of Folsomia candida]|uniref:type II toxin-antitoxin system RelE family toxin n=1 Tax=Wolbachia endosymbiont of Folsomia candida TaxID=169402 RepID=UPI000ACA8541|nr:type II toxin-antitoxin system RelE/ParE family toxin [Wolbachia endosymbiont of Folsomia candida]APR97823.1 type II toxin-antitoxin system RelE/ParE family toxin [Wolbachia endosymbiont of Folsomia candida]APR99023.1 type II toxin-antitoxin system RelE/ParE family toxin [Wolbachia endosymbiont of Folsomia candida]
MPSGIRPYNIDYSESVIKKDIPALPKKIKSIIEKAIMERLTVEPIGLGKPLRHDLSGQYSLRVSTYRILYYIDAPAHTVVITSIEHRKDSYQS